MCRVSSPPALAQGSPSPLPSAILEPHPRPGGKWSERRARPPGGSTCPRASSFPPFLAGLCLRGLGRGSPRPCPVSTPAHGPNPTPAPSDPGWNICSHSSTLQQNPTVACDSTGGTLEREWAEVSMSASTQYLHFVHAYEIFGALEKPTPAVDGPTCQIQYVLVPFAGLCAPQHQQ